VVSTAERVAQRYLAASSGYGPHFSKIVQAVDACDAALKKLPAAKQAVEEIRKLIAHDPDIEALPGLNKYAPEQQCGLMEKSIDQAERSIKELSRGYDEANSSFLRMGLK
jgi:hypothetical protein